MVIQKNNQPHDMIGNRQFESEPWQIREAWLNWCKWRGHYLETEPCISLMCLFLVDRGWPRREIIQRRLMGGQALWSAVKTEMI